MFPSTSLPLGAVSHLTAGRSQIGTSLSFHLFFAVRGAGPPLMMLVAEGCICGPAIRCGGRWLGRWSKVFAVLFAVGAASGTIISFERGLLFPRFMAYAGGIIDLPFSLEGAAFFIVTANAWMNVPRGFQIVGGRVTHVDPPAAIFNPAWATETSHMVLGAYLATAFGVASVYAAGMLRGRRNAYHRKAPTLGLSSRGDPRSASAGRRRPARTDRGRPPAGHAGRHRGGRPHRARAGLNVGGFPLPGHNGDVLNVKVPHLLSGLAFDRTNARVRGLDTLLELTVRRWPRWCVWRSSAWSASARES